MARTSTSTSTTSKSIAKTFQRSKQVLEYCEQYQVTPEVVYFAYLICSECNPVESYIVSHKSNILDSTKAKEKVRGLYKTFPRLPELITAISEGKPGAKESEEALYSKEDILRLLQREVKNVEGKDKAGVLMKIADLRNFKSEETQPEEDRVLFYLPKIDSIK